VIRIADLYCCGGGATRGLQQAAAALGVPIHVTGFDIKRHKRYCGDAFEQRDVLSLTPAELRERFDFAHASPKCQKFTKLKHAPNAKGDEHPNQIPDTLTLLSDSGIWWLLENVEEAAPWMPGAITLCGTMFGLGAQGCELQRHRLFMANFPISPPGPCAHSGGPVIGVYGGHGRKRSAKHGGRGTRDVWEGGHVAACSEAMGMDWATLEEMSEAIPPAYTEWLGRQLLAHIQAQRAAA
jgi:DNA (cytosine-5)-methyltransferase 1